MGTVSVGLIRPVGLMVLGETVILKIRNILGQGAVLLKVRGVSFQAV